MIHDHLLDILTTRPRSFRCLLKLLRPPRSAPLTHQTQAAIPVGGDEGGKRRTASGTPRDETRSKDATSGGSNHEHDLRELPKLRELRELRADLVRIVERIDGLLAS